MDLADVTIRPQQTVHLHDSIDSVEEMLLDEKYLVVTRDDDGEYCGVLTPTDVVEHRHRLVADCLVARETVDDGTSLERALELMDQRSVHFLPVSRAGRFVGVASYKTIVETIADLGHDRRSTLPAEDLRFIAGGVAHDVKTLLFAIGEHLQLVRSDGLSQQQAENTAAVEDALDRARRLMERFLRLARDEVPIAPACQVGEFVAECVGFYATGSGVSVELDLADDLQAVALPSDLLGRVIANLVVNAVQASPPAGVVRVRAANRRLHGDCWLELVVTNRGPRIEPEMLPRIFEPYFTTRKGGSGLGLAIVRSIVIKAGGTVEVASDREQTSFTVLLPVESAAASLELVGGGRGGPLAERGSR